jgi:hypothetical protein
MKNITKKNTVRKITCLTLVLVLSLSIALLGIGQTAKAEEPRLITNIRLEFFDYDTGLPIYFRKSYNVPLETTVFDTYIVFEIYGSEIERTTGKIGIYPYYRHIHTFPIHTSVIFPDGDVEEHHFLNFDADWGQKSTNPALRRHPLPAIPSGLAYVTGFPGVELEIMKTVIVEREPEPCIWSPPAYRTTHTIEVHVRATRSDQETPQQTPSADVPSSWAVRYVNEAAELGLVPQNLQSAYTQATTRAEFTALAVALYEAVTGREITGRVTFNDTNDVNVEKMAYLGVVMGVGNDRFDPNAQLTREQAAVMIYRLTVNITGRPLPRISPSFADNANISPWAVSAVGQMQFGGIMGGVGNNQFAPQGDYTREQSITTILRLFNALAH